MLVVLQTPSDGAPDRRVQLRADQVLVVGRSGWADFSVAADDSLLDEHFEVRCEPDGCVIRALSAESPTTVNGDAIATTLVYDGDEIQAGQTTFRITIEGGPARPSNVNDEQEETPEAEPNAPLPVEAAAAGLVGLCAFLEFGDDVKAQADSVETADDLIASLASQKNYPDALRLRAYVLEKRQAVWWGYRCLRDELDEPLPADQTPAVDAAFQWVRDPTEERRRIAEARAADINYSGAGATLALSAFWSDGSLAPEGSPDVDPDERLTSQGVAAALITAAYAGNPTLAPQKLDAFLKLGMEISEGKVPLPEGEGAG